MVGSRDFIIFTLNPFGEITVVRPARGTEWKVVVETCQGSESVTSKLMMYPGTGAAGAMRLYGPAASSSFVFELACHLDPGEISTGVSGKWAQVDIVQKMALCHH